MNKQRRHRRLGCIGMVLAVLLLAGLALDRITIPTDEAMISRFIQNCNALESVHQLDFVSAAAFKRWRRALRVRNGYPEWHADAGRHFEVHFARRLLHPGGFTSKGYAYRTNLETQPGARYGVVFGDSLDGGTPPGFTYRHIEGNWYLYVLKSG